MYDFHSLALIIPLFFWLFYFLESERSVAYVICFVLLLLCREDISLFLIFVGLYALSRATVVSKRLGWATIFASIAYFVWVKSWVMTPEGLLDGSHSHSYNFYFADMDPQRWGPIGILVSAVTNPEFALRHALANSDKLLFFLQVFVPLGFLPFLARRGKVMLLLGVSLCAFASRKYVFSVHFQYSSWILPFAFFLTVVALKNFQDFLGSKKIPTAFLTFMLVTAFCLSCKHGALFPNKSFRGGFRPVVRTLSAKHLRLYDDLRSLIALVPQEASIQATTTLGPHISNRQNAFRYGDVKKSDFVLVDEKSIKKKHRTHYAKLKQGKMYRLVERKGRLVLYERVGDSDEGT